jgi:hypothetical protein
MTNDMKELLQVLFVPPYSIEELENSQTVCGCKHEITTMHFDDGLRNYPSHSSGFIHDQQNGLTYTSWDRWGNNKTAGKRIREYDLVRPARKEIVRNQLIAIGFVGVLIIVIVLLCV